MLSAPVTLGGAWPTSPSMDSPAGSPTAMTTTRMLCTIAIARRSPPSSAPKRQNLRHAAGRRGKIRVNLIPAMYKLQISSTTDRDEGHGQQQHRNAERISCHPVQCLRCHHGAERYADQHEDRAHQQCRNQHWPTGERCTSHRQNRTRQPAGRNADETQCGTARGRNRQRFGKVAQSREAVGGGRRRQDQGSQGAKRTLRRGSSDAINAARGRSRQILAAMSPSRATACERGRC